MLLKKDFFSAQKKIQCRFDFVLFLLVTGNIYSPGGS